MMAPPWLQLMDDTIRACAAHGTPDLLRRLRERRAQLIDPKLRILVIGETGQGKSQLVNALVNAPVCATGDDLTTTVPAVVEYAEAPTAAVVLNSAARDDRMIESGPSNQLVPAAVDSVTADANREAAQPGTEIARAHIGLPRALLATGLVLIDTPPAGDAVRTATALSEILQADAVLMATDATSEFSPSELELLGQVARVCPTVMVALTKIDIVPGWRVVAERNRARLARAGVSATVVPVSAALRLAAAKTGDRDLNAESGFEELMHRLKHEWLDQADVLHTRSVAALAGMTVDQLVPPLHEEFATTQRGDAPEVVARWQAAGRKLEQLQQDSARWQTLLGDEIADLIADLEYDLRDRTRQILREVDEYFDAADPSRDWDTFEDWLQDNLATVAETNFNWLLERFDWIAHKLARQVAPGDQDLLHELLVADAPPDHASGMRKPRVERFTVGQKLFVGMRGSYTGLLMFGLATTVAGMPLINPISLGAGAAFGAKSVFEERGNRLKRRQATAKTAAQRHVDDFFLAYGKESKDAARLLQRALRDRFTAYAQQQRQEITASAKAIKQVIDAEAARRKQRAQEIRTAVNELAAIRQRVKAMAAAKVAPSSPRGLIA
ncbi:dynamin family protein [Amycolatopsis sp. YIM 10]|uniref:dynamin family protein n=1 Tax=Amycolatopsis sp. YIM 10 TaxID=2653857 RepID=UPI00128FEA35|nr:dynamin family protein [Amycolatopsis sp. YIM 10]